MSARRSRRNTSYAPLTLVLLSAVALSGPRFASAEGPGDEASKFSIHGYVSQAWGKTNGNQVQGGITEDGTFGLQNVALQLRYDFSPKDAIAVQFSHELVGASPSQAVIPDVKLNWAIYEHRFDDDTSLKLGRFPVPLGLYNEVRHVGTVLPFYGAPAGIYLPAGSASYNIETLEGLVLSRSLGGRTSWRADLRAFVGETATTQLADPANTPAGSAATAASVTSARARRYAGAELWLQSPLPGLRVGGGAARFDLPLALLGSSQEQAIHRWNASLEGEFTRFQVRGEHASQGFEQGGYYRSSYVQLGVRLIERLTLNAQLERTSLVFVLPLPQGSLRFDRSNFNRELSLGLNYRYRPSVVAKLEWHRAKGYAVEGQPVFQLLSGPPLKTTYFLASVSASF